MITANDILELAKGSKINFTFKMGLIDPSYSSGRPKIIFDGESAASAKQYPYLSSYTPVKGDKVLIAIVAGTYVVIGKIV